jgi:hypothetical protein
LLRFDSLLWAIHNWRSIMLRTQVHSLCIWPNFCHPL